MRRKTEGTWALDKGEGRPEDLLTWRWFLSATGAIQASGTDGDGSHPPGSERGLLAALDVDRAELLHAA